MKNKKWAYKVEIIYTYYIKNRYSVQDGILNIIVFIYICC